jgi:uncharacterized protein (TIGR03435 family)
MLSSSDMTEIQATFAVACLAFQIASAFSQPSFAVASVKPSQRLLGPDANNRILFTPNGFNARNATLKRLIAEAHNLQPYQISGPVWLDQAEYDLDAKADSAQTRDQLRLMLRTLLVERFRLTQHRESRELRVYVLTVAKSGVKIQSAGGTAAPGGTFRGDLQQFANLLSVQLTIPTIDDPTRPSVASGAQVPVIDQTGLIGIYDFPWDPKPDATGDMLTLVQRVLPGQLGLKLECRKERVEFLVIDQAERTPSPN